MTDERIKELREQFPDSIEAKQRRAAQLRIAKARGRARNRLIRKGINAASRGPNDKYRS